MKRLIGSRNVLSWLYDGMTIAFTTIFVLIFFFFFVLCSILYSSVGKRTYIGAGGLGIDSRASQIRHRVVNFLLQLRRYFRLVLSSR